MRTIRLFLTALVALFGGLLIGQTVNSSYTTGTTIGSGNLTVMASDNDATNTIALSGNLVINGNVVFGAKANSKLAINIGATTVIRPSAPNIATGVGYGHLILFADTGAKITINVNNDLTLTGTNPDNGSSSALATLAGDMNLTFSGAGQVEFVIADSKTVSLTSLYESSPGTFVATQDAKGSGVRGVILMDHDDTKVWSNGVNKVVVSRKISSWDPNSSEMQNDITFSIGHNSFLTFGSNNKTGLDPASSNGISANETAAMLSAALAFDVSCAGPGRMLLKIAGMSTANTYRDGALTIGGNLIDDGSGGLGNLSNPDHIRLNLQLNKPAGGYAYMRITDEKAYAYSSYSTSLGTALTDYLSGGSGIALDTDGNPSSRGLWIINSNNSYPSSAANPYADSCWYNKEIFTNGKGRSAIRPGFVMGVNGHLYVYHNTFVHHIATVNTRAIDTTAQSMTTLASHLSTASQTVNSATITHNPSAMIIDGFATYSGAAFQAYKYGTVPKITLWGSAQLFVSSGVSSTGSGSVVTTPSYTIGTGTYDGYKLPLSGSVETGGVGEHVLDVQGLCNWRTFLDSAVTDTVTPFARHAGTLMGRYLPDANNNLVAQDGGLGTISIGSVEIDYTGTPLKSDGTQIGSWPLTIGNTYKRYNRGCINVNNDITMRYVRFNHLDVSRDVQRDHVAASPAIIGGEYTMFASKVANTTVDLPTIWLENAQLRCHESLCLTGVRIAVKEQVNSSAPFVEDNSSTIYLFNHGDVLDNNLRGYGRILQFGSQAHTLAGGGSDANLISAYGNIFRQTVGTLVTELLFDSNIEDGVLDQNQQSFQLVHLGNASNLSVGWTSTQGIISKPAGGGSTSVVYPWQGIQVPVIGTGWTLFPLDATSTSRATLKINGNLLYFSASANGGATPPSIISSASLGGVVYVNHGGELVAGEVYESGGGYPSYTPRAAFDVPIALRVAQSTLTTYNPMGTLTVPFDQLKFLKGVQPYNIDTDFAIAQGQNVDLSFQRRANGLSSDLTIPWSTVKKNTSLPFKNINLLPEFERAFGGAATTRNVGVQTTAVTLPTSGLIKFGSGVAIEQLGIAGATTANPITMYLTGDGTSFATIREVVSVASANSPFVPGEGANAAIFMDKDASLGIGSRSWNSNSVNAWNLLGKNKVTLVPNGNCIVELNEDVIISDAQPIIPTTNFGATGAQRITFYSEAPREFRIPAGGELDLSAFGGLSNGTNQQITFDGNVKVIFEPGATLRFPNVGHSNNQKGPVLYMNGRSQLIFEGLNDRDSTRLAARNLSSSNNVSVGRSRIIGCGKIWLNKNATMKIMDSACVGIEADSRTLETDILVSIAKEAALLIGDPNAAGGILQVGNVTDLSNGGNIFTNVYFTLRLNGPRALVHMDRQAFLGFGAGVVSRYQLQSGSLNSQLNNMTVQSLYNVADVAIRAAQGSFSHNQVYDGTNSEASLLAIGPASSYTVDLGVATESIWRGGGNMVYVTEDATANTPLQISVLSTAQGLSDEYTRNVSGVATGLNTVARTSNNGKVSMMGSGIISRQITQASMQYPGPLLDIEKISSYYLTNVLADSDNGSAPTLLGGKHFTGPQPDVFRYLSFTPFANQTPSKYCVLGSTQFEFKIGYILGTAITRTTAIPMLGTAKPDGAAKVGALLAATLDTNGNPALYTLPEVPSNPPALFTAS